MLGDYSKVVPPGQEGKVELSINNTRGFSGVVTKYARVSTNDPRKRAITLILRATFKTPGP